MRRPFALAAALSIGLTAGAAAQVVGDDAVAAGETMAGQLHSNGVPVGWEGEVANAFFGTGGELLAEEEIRANWRRLDDGHQTQVIRDCRVFLQVSEPADAAVTQRSVAEPAPDPVFSMGEALSGDAVEDQESRDVAVEIAEEEADLPGARNQPGKEVADVTANPHLAQLHELCATVGRL